MEGLSGNLGVKTTCVKVKMNKSLSSSNRVSTASAPMIMCALLYIIGNAT